MIERFAARVGTQWAILIRVVAVVVNALESGRQLDSSHTPTMVVMAE